MNKIGFAVAALAATALGGCATVTRGTQQRYYVQSEPSGAEVKMTTGMSCTTPCNLKLRRKDEFTATISKEGYKSISVPIESKMHGGGGAALAGNVVAGGIIGGVIDGTNGSLRDLKPNPLAVRLAPVGSSEESVVIPGEKPDTKSKSKSRK
ncbi:MAG TPA: PEGA domain-containing protein [Allosphingosinicella sp.]|jgi:hypothetical protein